MASNVTSLQWKLILQKDRLVIKLVAIFVVVLSIVVIFGLSVNSCGLEHIGIINDLKMYENDMDPEFCADLVERINSFNSQCSPYVEILDCG